MAFGNNHSRYTAERHFGSGRRHEHPLHHDFLALYGRGCQLARVEVLQKGSTVNNDRKSHIGALTGVSTCDGVFWSRGKVEVEGT